MSPNINMSKILLPVEFSERCRGAARQAEALASRFGAQLVMLHVLPRMPAVYGGAGEVSAFYALPDLPEERMAYGKAELDRFPGDTPPGIDVCRMVLEGDPARRIVDYAHAAKVNLIVMPTHAYGPFRRFLLGSVAAKVLHDVNCPVWTGPHLEQAPQWETFAVRRVACAVDLGPHSRTVLEWAAGLAAEFRADLTVLHAIGVSNASVGPFYFDPQWRGQMTRRAAECMDELLRKLEIRAEGRVLTGEVAAAVSGAVRDTRADVLVIGRGQNSGVLGRLRANAYAIIREAPCPVASV